MQAVLLTLGILGFGAVVISVYVFMVSARRYVHDRIEEPHRPRRAAAPEKLYISRSGRDRRQSVVTGFPLRLQNGLVVHEDRRQGERRSAAAA